MAEAPDAVEKWKQLHVEWKEAEQRARAAQADIRLSFERGRLGSAGPTIEAVQRADDLQNAADVLRLAVDAHVSRSMR